MDLFCYLCFVFVFVIPCSLVVTCWEKVDLLALFCVMFLCVLSLSHTVLWVRCGTWLYCFLVVVFFLTLTTSIIRHADVLQSRRHVFPMARLQCCCRATTSDFSLARSGLMEYKARPAGHTRPRHNIRMKLLITLISRWLSLVLLLIIHWLTNK